jgi:hypothetical protein
MLLAYWRKLLGHYFLFPTTFVRVGDELRRTQLRRSSQNAPSETIRKALQALVATPDRPPRRSFSPHFGPRTVRIHLQRVAQIPFRTVLAMMASKVARLVFTSPTGGGVDSAIASAFGARAAANSGSNANIISYLLPWRVVFGRGACHGARWAQASGVRMTLPRNLPASPSSWTRAISESGKRSLTSTLSSPESTRSTMVAS